MVGSFLIVAQKTWIINFLGAAEAYITKTRLYNFDPLKLHFYIVKLGLIEVSIIVLISAQKT